MKSEIDQANAIKITPLLAARVVKEYLMPMFKGKQKGLIGLERFNTHQGYTKKAQIDKMRRSMSVEREETFPSFSMDSRNSLMGHSTAKQNDQTLLSELNLSSQLLMKVQDLQLKLDQRDEQLQELQLQAKFNET